MRTLIACLVIFAAACQSSSSVAWAQFVQVGPGYVRAPFVRVYNNPDGSTRVLAPFVDVVTPGARYDSRELRRLGRGIRGRSFADELATMDWQTLRRLLRDVAADLDRKLSRMPTGEYWQEQFRTREIASLVTSQVDGPPNEEERQVLLDISQFYMDAGSKTELRAITRLRSFRNLRAVLREFVTPEETRLRLRLQATSLELQRQLARYPNGDRWWNHLALPDLVYIHEEATESQASAVPNRTIVPTASDFADLQAASDRYDSVSQDARYRIIADLPAFHSTQVLLSEYIRAVQPQLPEPPPPAAEELPTPAPEQRETTNP